MKRLTAMTLCVMLLMTGTLSLAEDGADVKYAGGTAPGIKEGAAGKLDTVAVKELTFQTGTVKLSVPYEQVTRVEYREENRFKLGVVGTIVVGILKAREKVHTVTITWHDEKDTANVVTLEMTRERATDLLDVLKARTRVMPTVCEAKFNRTCTDGKSE